MLEIITDFTVIKIWSLTDIFQVYTRLQTIKDYHDQTLYKNKK
jgi:hypothetical protein